MKKMTHAWLAFMAIKRLEETGLSRANRKYADSLIKLFKSRRDDVPQGAWYPDAVIKDMASSHVLKITPSAGDTVKFRRLPTTLLSYQYGKRSPVKKKAFTIDKHDNLPDRCESIAHSVIDHLKIQKSEDKGSPVLPTDNQVALLLFMLSHYVADAHMPLHCDSRKFSDEDNVHGRMEGEWDDMVKRHYRIDDDNERFYYDPDGYPLRDLNRDQEYQSSFLKTVEDELLKRKFFLTWGAKNKNVWDYMSAVCQHSYLLSYCFLPPRYDHTSVTSGNWQSLGKVAFKELSTAVLADAIDSIARIWFRVWRRYEKWKKGK